MYDYANETYLLFIKSDYEGDESRLFADVGKLLSLVAGTIDRHLQRDAQIVKLLLQVLEFSGFNTYLTMDYNRHMQCVCSLNALIIAAFKVVTAEFRLLKLLMSKLLAILIDSRTLRLF